MKFKLTLVCLLINFLSCTAPKEIINKVNKSQIKYSCPETTFMTIAPKLSIDEWLPDFNKMIRDVPNEVSRNQIGISSNNEIKQECWCYPSARPFVQLDTICAIKNIKGLNGLWRVCCNRTIQFKDTVSFKDSTFNRSNTLVRDDNGEDDVIVLFKNSNVKLYYKKKGSNSYKLAMSRHYKILNGRYLLIYNKLRTTSGTAFVGITKENKLIWNQYAVNMDTYYSFGKSWLTTMHQFIFEKID
jgi:hypothetical protein